MPEFRGPGAPPERVGPYRILDKLGEGGMGVVYLAFDEPLGRRVALKWLKQATPATVERLRQEAHLHARVEHPAVCRLYQVAEWEGWPYLVMQLIQGRTLDRIAPELSTPTKLRLMATLADGVHAAHRQGLIHRDLKPTNLMVEADEAGGWRPYVMDFGLARDEASGTLTEAGMILGSPSYMAPEQVSGGWIDVRTDVYGLGAVLFEVFAGRPPFQGQAAEILVQVQTQDPPRLRELKPELPRDLETVIQTCLARDPARRYPSAAALRDDLQRMLDGEPVKARRASHLECLGHWIRRNRLASGLAALALASLLAAGLIGEAGRRRTLTQANWAQHIGREAEQMEALLFKAQSLPLHDIRPERGQVLVRIAQIRQELSNQGPWSQAAGRLAIGRGLLALGRLEEARTELEVAWRASRRRDPDIAQALGLTLARLSQRELEGLSGKLREERKKAIEADLLGPARELLHRAEALQSENTLYVEAVLALIEERPEEALDKAREAGRRLPWFFEASVLEAEIFRNRAASLMGRGHFPQAEGCLEESRAALERAMTIGRSAPMAHQGEVQRRMLVFQLRMNRGKATRADLDWALGAVNDALKVDPEDWRVQAFASAIHRRWGTMLMERGEDAGPTLDEAIRAAEAGLRQSPEDTPLLNNLGTALRYRAGCESDRGADPRPTLARAVSALQKVLDRPSFKDFILDNLGNCHALKGGWELQHGIDPTATLRLACECFQKASSLRPWAGHSYSEGLAWLDLATFETWQGRDPRPALDAALKAMQESLALNANSYGTRRAMAEVLLERAQTARNPEELRQAELHLEEALRLDASLAPFARIQRARALVLRAAWSRAPRALEEARQALEAISRNPVPRDLALPWAQSVALCPGASPALAASALKALEGAKASRPWDARLPLWRGRLLLELGRRREGLAGLREAQSLNANLAPLADRWIRGD